jgi:hypothetical protein
VLGFCGLMRTRMIIFGWNTPQAMVLSCCQSRDQEDE